MKKLLLLAFCIGLFSCSGESTFEELKEIEIVKQEKSNSDIELILVNEKGTLKLVEIVRGNPSPVETWFIICGNGHPSSTNTGNFCATDGHGGYVRVNWITGAPPGPDWCSGGHYYLGWYDAEAITYCSKRVAFCGAC